MERGETGVCGLAAAGWGLAAPRTPQSTPRLQPAVAERVRSDCTHCFSYALRVTVMSVSFHTSVYRTVITCVLLVAMTNVRFASHIVDREISATRNSATSHPSPSGPPAPSLASLDLK